MHESAVFQDLMRKIDEVARANGLPRVQCVHLWIGALSHFTEASLREHWEFATLGTIAEGSRLEVAVSEDRFDPRAQGVVLVRVDGDGGEGDR